MNASACGKYRGLIVAGLVFLAVLGVVAYRGSNRFVETGSQIARSYQVLEKLREIEALLQEDESALRGFLLTGKEEFLKPVAELREKLQTGSAVQTANFTCASKESTFTGTYQNAKPCLLRFSLQYKYGDRLYPIYSQNTLLRVVVHSPDGQTYDWKDSYNGNLGVPDAPVGEWTYTITPGDDPDNSPFTLTIKQATVPESLARLAEKEGWFTNLSDEDKELTGEKCKVVQKLADLVAEYLKCSDEILAAAKNGLEAGRTSFGQGKSQELCRQIHATAEEIRANEENSLKHRLVDVRESAAFLGETVVGVHFVYIAIVVVGQVLVLVGWACRWQWVRNLWFRLIHLTMILIVIVESLLSIKCPLTDWEANLKLAAGLKAAEGGFIARWLHKLIVYDGARSDDLMFTIAYGCFGAVVLASFWLVPPRRTKNPLR